MATHHVRLGELSTEAAPTQFRPYCNCGWSGIEWCTRARALDQGAEHVNDVGARLLYCSVDLGQVLCAEDAGQLLVAAIEVRPAARLIETGANRWQRIDIGFVDGWQAYADAHGLARDLSCEHCGAPALV